MFLSCDTYWRDIYFFLYMYLHLPLVINMHIYSLHISWNRKRKLKKTPSFDFKWCSVRFKITELSFAPWNLMVLYWRCFFLPISKLNTTTLVSAVTIQYFIMWRNIMSIPLCQYWRSLYWPFSKREI